MTRLAGLPVPADAPSWLSAQPKVPEQLLSHVRSWVGYHERTGMVSRRRELPAPHVVVIFEFGPPIRHSAAGSLHCDRDHRGGFVAGLADSFTLTEHDGEQAGIQVNLTPLGARAVFGMPARELSRTVQSLPDVLRDCEGMCQRLGATDSWSERFEVVSRWLWSRVQGGRPTPASTAWAVTRIEASGGRARIGDLARQLGCSRKHLNSLFSEHVGLSPKTYAELVRFDALTREVSRCERPWAQLALEGGYSDQAHLAREVRRFAGLSPTQLRQLFVSEQAGHPRQ